MSPHYERARTLYALWRLLTTHESGVAVVDEMMVRMGPTHACSEGVADIVLKSARIQLRGFQRDMLAWHPDQYEVSVSVMGPPDGGPFGHEFVTVAMLRVGHQLPRLEREFLELCVDPSFPHLRPHPGPVPA